MSLDEVLFEGNQGRGMARGDAEFAIDGAQVGIDGAWTDDQRISNLSIGESLCDQPQHLHLPLGQVVGKGGEGPCCRAVAALLVG